MRTTVKGRGGAKPRADNCQVVEWTPHVGLVADREYPLEFIKVRGIIEKLDEIFPESFGQFKHIYKRSLVGRCLTKIGHTKHSTHDKYGAVYRRNLPMKES